MTTTNGMREVDLVDYDEAVARYDPVFGIEVHVELGTRTKMFCPSIAVFGDEPNTAVSPVSLGLPGALPVVNGTAEERMRVGCGSATIGMFARQWFGKVDEVVVVDDHITGVLSEHQAGKYLGIGETGIRMKGRRSTPGRYFQVAEPGTGWGGTNISDPLSILEPSDKKVAKPGTSMLMVSTCSGVPRVRA